jgi:alpha-1,3-mannosyltransferase
LKILEICRSYYPSIGGLEQFVSQRTKIYKDLGFEYQILTTTYSTEKIDISYIPKSVIYLSQFTKYNIVPNLRGFNFDGYDLISVNQLGNFLSDFSIIKASVKSKRIILTPHLSFHTQKFNWLKKIHSKILIPFLLKRVSIIICFTDYEIDYWHHSFNIPKEKLVKIPHYFNKEITAENEIDTQDKFILYLGRNYSNKKINLLMKAYHALQNLNYKLYLTISDKELDEELLEVVMSDRRIRLLGQVSEEYKNKLLSICEALVLPSDYEAFGIVLFEASQFKKPILCSSLPVIQEIMDPRGCLFFENNISSIYKSLEKFNSLNENELEKMGRINFENLQKYSFNRVKKLYSSILDSYSIS